MDATEEWIEDLADAILDGAPIDWASAESSAGFVDRPLLDQLRLLATIAELHRLPRSRNALDMEKGPAIVDGKYRLEGCLGHGGMGFVYRARHRNWGSRSQ